MRSGKASAIFPSAASNAAWSNAAENSKVGIGIAGAAGGGVGAAA
jgi:hypothetical protein